jgi:hypothetical protein
VIKHSISTFTLLLGRTAIEQLKKSRLFCQHTGVSASTLPSTPKDNVIGMSEACRFR